MKKNYVIFVAVVFCLVFCSCKKDVAEKTIFPAEQYVRVSAINQLKVLNDSLLMTSTRGLWSAFRNACAIAGADILGVGAGIAAVKEIAFVTGCATGGTGFLVVCGVGATIGAVGASSLAWDSCYGTRAIDVKYQRIEPNLLLDACALAQEDLEQKPDIDRKIIPNYIH